MTDENPIQIDVLMSEILISTSLFFAGNLNHTLQEHPQKFVFFLLIIALLLIQFSLNNLLVEWANKEQTLWGDIVVECTSMISRTLSFLLVSFIIEILSSSSDSIVQQVFLPFLFIFFGIAVLKKISYEKKSKDDAINKIKAKGRE